MTEETKKPQGVSDVRPETFQAEAPAVKPAEKTQKARTLKVRRIGNSLGVVLPKELLAKLRVGEGAELSVSETPNGVALQRHDAELQEQIEAARLAMKRYRNALRELAK
jgi:putative addiction module antidote